MGFTPTRVLVIGGADQGRQVIDAIAAGDTLEVAGVLDRDLAVGAQVAGKPVLGDDHALGRVAPATGATAFVVAIGDNYTRGVILERETAACAQLALATVIHPGAVVAGDAVVGEGSIVLAGAVVGNGSVIGRGALLGINASVDHDCTVDELASLAPGVATGGNVHIGAYTALGVGAAVIHGITIGTHTVVGAGAVVTHDLPGHTLAYGVPARAARARTEGEPYLGTR